MGTLTRRAWEDTILAPSRANLPERAAAFRTASGHPVDVLYTPDDVAGIDYQQDIGDPGAFPYTRGAHVDGELGQPWWLCVGHVGCGAPAPANQRLRHLLADGATALSVTFDGVESSLAGPRRELAGGIVADRGVRVQTVAEMAALFADVPIGEVAVSLDAGEQTPVVFAQYLAAAEIAGMNWTSLTGNLLGDVIGLRAAGGRGSVSLSAMMHLVIDALRFGCREVPAWTPIVASGVPLRAAGATARQELALTIGSAIEYVRAALRVGLGLEVVAPRVGFTFAIGSDFFEEIAKLRAARRVWALVMRGRFGAADGPASAMRVYARIAGASPLTSGATAVDYDTVPRAALQTLAAVLAGAESVGPVCELPTSEAATLALRTQQILAHECGLAGRRDPLGGAWWLERLTRDMVDQALADLDVVERVGGMAAAVEEGLPQRDIAEAARAGWSRRSNSDERRVVPAEIQRIDSPDGAAQIRSARDEAAVQRTLGMLAREAAGTGQVMSTLVACARTGATLTEMCRVLRETWGDAAATVP